MSFLVVVTDEAQEPQGVQKTRSSPNRWPLTPEGIEIRRLRATERRQRVAELQRADALVVDQCVIHRALLRTLPRCRAIIRHGDGYDNLDLAAATREGIVCANKPGFWSREVGEHAFVMALAAYCRVPLAIVQKWYRRARQSHTRALTQERWMAGLRGRQVGIVGFGRTGKEAAMRFAKLRCAVVIHDPTVTKDELTSYRTHYATALPRHCSFEEIISLSDIVSLHVPASPANRHLLKYRHFRGMKRSAVVVNCARGSLIATKDLVRALHNGEIAAAALDTTEPESLPSGHPLTQMKNCILTPHVAWYSEPALRAMRESIVEDLRAIRARRPPLTPLNREVLALAQCRL